MSDTIKELGDELADLLKEQAKGAAADAIVDLEEVKAYVAERMTHLASIVGEPGYREAVEAEAHSVAAMAACRAIDTADAADARLIGIVQGALAIAAKAISIAI